MTTKTGILAALFLFCLTAAIRPADAEDAIAQDSTAAVIMAYQRVGEDEYPSADISADMFADHITELQNGGYNVMALPAVVAALKAGTALPPHTVVLTFDGGHRSVMTNAVPLLLRHNLPFTLFIATDFADQKAPDYIGWDELKKLARNKLVTIGLHPAAYAGLNAANPSEIKRQINKARDQLRAVLGLQATLFAYPFGQYSSAYHDIVAASGFDAAFGQQSGVAYAGADLFALPRFVMTESFGDLDRFRMTANALPLPVTEVQPKDSLLTAARPAIGFTVDPALVSSLSQLVCFAADQDKPQMQIIGKNRVELRLAKDFTADRARINCTLPGPVADPDEEQRWRWFGLLFSVPAAQASDDQDMPQEDSDTDGGAE